MTKDEQYERDRLIWEMHALQYMTFAAIGRRMGLSRERVRQIVRSIDPKVEEE